MKMSDYIWQFTLRGQPPSVNHSYTIITKYRYNARGQKVPYSSLALKEAVRDYQDAAIYVIRPAKPSGWKPKGFVRTYFWFYLNRDADCDNVMKSIHDAMKKATGVDDDIYLPVAMEKSTGWKKAQARVEVVVEDPASPLSVPRS